VLVMRHGCYGRMCKRERECVCVCEGERRVRGRR
jgi:hypothetical protein